MLVGDVRWATTGVGVSWKLSGGSALCSGVTKVVKYRHVRRATSRSARASAAESGAARTVVPGRLTQRATSGDSAQSAPTGNAIGNASARRHTTAATTAAASATPPAMRRYNSAGASPAFDAKCSVGVHWSRWRCVTYVRPRARPIASVISHA